MKRLLSLMIAGTLFISCSKEGVGGSKSISGTVKRIIIAPNGNAVDTVSAVDRDVFIQYGEEDYYNDDVKTNSEGYYEFSYLRKGDYKVFAYSDCISCDAGKNKVEMDIELKKSASNQNLMVRKEVDYDDGSSSISGRLMAQHFAGSFEIGSPFPSQENEVYITYEDEEVYFDRMDTGVDGKFEFKNLIKGTYTLYAFSECETCENEWDTVSVQIQVKDNYSVNPVGDLNIQLR